MANLGKKVLLVEDDPFLSLLLKNRLQKEGFEVILAKDGQEALETVVKRAWKPDLILIDVILPGKSGFEVLEEIKANAQLKGTVMVIMSNLGQEEDIKRGKELGAHYFIKSQTPLDELMKKLKELLKI